MILLNLGHVSATDALSTPFKWANIMDMISLGRSRMVNASVMARLPRVTMSPVNVSDYYVSGYYFSGLLCLRLRFHLLYNKRRPQRGRATFHPIRGGFSRAYTRDAASCPVALDLIH